MRRRKRAPLENPTPSVPVWMITFSDMVTLLMTFVVMLVSMASLVDEDKRKNALGSVSGSFGLGAADLDDLTTVADNQTVDPGPINLFKDLAPLRKRIQDRPDSDLKFESNRFIQRVSLSADALFAPGSAILTADGFKVLERIRPTLVESTYPIGIAGHAGTGRDELGDAYQPGTHGMDFSWKLSMDRAMAVYAYLVQAGIPTDKIRVESFGRFRPKASDDTPAGRKSNRRVDITIDKRIGSWSPEMARAREEEQAEKKSSFSIRDFMFRFDLPGGK